MADAVERKKAPSSANASPTRTSPPNAATLTPSSSRLKLAPKSSPPSAPSTPNAIPTPRRNTATFPYRTSGQQEVPPLTFSVTIRLLIEMRVFILRPLAALLALVLISCSANAQCFFGSLDVHMGNSADHAQMPAVASMNDSGMSATAEAAEQCSGHAAA